MRYRIKQISDDVFIAQVKETWYYKWESIDNVINLSWSTNTKYHYNDTYEKAIDVIERHKKYIAKKKEYPKYYKI